MYLWIMIGAYTYPKLFLHVNRIHGYLGCIIAFYLSGILGMTIFIVRCKEWDLIKIIGFILMLAQLECQYWNSYQSIIMILLGNIVPVLYLYIFYQCSLWDAYLWEIIYLANIALLKEPYVAYVGTFKNRSFIDFFLWPREHLYSEILYVIIIYSMILLMNKYICISRWINPLLKEHKKYLFIMTCAEVYVLSILMHFGEGKITENNLTITLIVLMILVLGLLFVYLKMQERLIKSEKNILNMRFETMTEQYKELKKSYDKYRCLLHDEKHMILYLNECLDNRDIKEAKKILRGYKELTFTKDKAIWTGISTLDFMLNIKIEKMREQEIEFKINSQVEKIPMEELDFIMMMGNLLDNAIEAVQDYDLKNIWVEMREMTDIIHVAVKNNSRYYKQEELIQLMGMGYSTKAQNRGIGLSKAKDILMEYECDLRIYCEENENTRIVFDFTIEKSQRT